MKGRKGQALVEFILVIPVFIFIIMGAIDFGNIIYQRFLLYDKLDNIITFYNENNFEKINAYTEKEKINFNYQLESEFTTLEVSKTIKINTPGLKLIFDNPYTLKVSRSIYEK